MPPPAQTSRKFLWPLLAGFVVLMVGYFFALGTDLFDIAPEEYPEMQPKGKSGKSVRVEDVFAASPAFQKWKMADTEASEQDWPQSWEIRKMLTGEEKPNLAGIPNWIIRAHLAKAAIDEICAQPGDWAEGWDGKSSAIDWIATHAFDRRALQLDLSLLGLLQLSDRDAGMSLLRANARLVGRASELDQNIYFSLHTFTLQTLLCGEILRTARFAQWSQDEKILQEMAEWVSPMENAHHRHRANMIAGEFHHQVGAQTEMRRKLLAACRT